MDDIYVYDNATYIDMLVVIKDANLGQINSTFQICTWNEVMLIRNPAFSSADKISSITALQILSVYLPVFVGINCDLVSFLKF